MGKISTVVSTSTVKSPNLELSTSLIETKAIPRRKKVINQTRHGKSVTIFKQLIVITTVVFSFGGLGFGFGLRYSSLMDIHQSKNLPLNHLSD